MRFVWLLVIPLVIFLWVKAEIWCGKKQAEALEKARKEREKRECRLDS